MYILISISIWAYIGAMLIGIVKYTEIPSKRMPCLSKTSNGKQLMDEGLTVHMGYSLNSVKGVI